MSSPASFDPAQVFQVFGMRPVATADFDQAVVHAPGDDLRCVFLWGQDCYNCNLFKQAALLHRQALLALGLTWFQADVYADEALGRRFSLHGVPTFVLFRGGRRLGRITGWPGLPRFTEAIERLLKNPAGNPS
ncbi:thioredoxin [Bordetella petrii]|nr:thioredoxin [Bordetella petrii]